LMLRPGLSRRCGSSSSVYLLDAYFRQVHAKVNNI
jgi:hypothetical protein